MNNCDWSKRKNSWHGERVGALIIERDGGRGVVWKEVTGGTGGHKRQNGGVLGNCQSL